ncbi:MAG: hypothetical protein CSA35_06010 [Dethiosulfovibrio peptidovorans]|nr:MAG: hypothetical protein CSA35_06010 [Dethiosulfovibrio peptidovorans]
MGLFVITNHKNLISTLHKIFEKAAKKIPKNLAEFHHQENHRTISVYLVLYRRLIIRRSLYFRLTSLDFP